MSDCSNCKNENVNSKAVQYIVHESAMARAERSAKRLWIVVLVLIVMLVGTNGAWIWYESQSGTVKTAEEYQIEQDADGRGNNNSIFDGGEVNGESEN